MTRAHRSPIPSTTRLVRDRRWLCLAIGATLFGCTTHSPVALPERIAGQIPSDYRLDGRGLVIARFIVHTDGEPGFGAISNPMLVEFRNSALQGPPTSTPRG